MKEKDIKCLSAKFETEVRKIIDEEGSKNLSTYDLEVAISQRISKLQSELLATVLSDREREAGKKKTCPQCQHGLLLKDYREREILTTFDTIKIRRPHFYCPKCHKYGFFDKSESLSCHAKVSPRAAELICLFAQQSSFSVTSDLLKRMFFMQISESSVKNIAEGIGNEFYTEEGLLSEKTNPIPASIDTKIAENRSYLQIDGAMIHHLKEWKENKLGIIFSEGDIIRSGTGENERISLKHKTLVSSFAQGVGEFKKRIRYWLIKSGTFYAREIVIISDGAVWIENLISELLPGCTHILDWFHVKEKLWECAKKLFGETSERVDPWVKKYADMLWEGKIQETLTDLRQFARDSKKQTPLLELHQYFYSRVSRMNYAEYRRRGYYIGSGAIESANRYAIQDRLKKSGMMWSTKGANAIAKLKTLYLSGLWESLQFAA